MFLVLSCLMAPRSLLHHDKSIFHLVVSPGLGHLMEASATLMCEVSTVEILSTSAGDNTTITRVENLWLISCTIQRGVEARGGDLDG